MSGGTYVVRTLGCKANLYDSQLIEAELRRRGWRPHDGQGAADLCVVNSCTVTDEADRQSRRIAARLGRDNPRSRVVVTGCGAEVDPERLAGSRGIHYVVGNQDKPALVELILSRLEAEPEAPVEGQVLGEARSYPEMLSRHPMDREWPAVEECAAPPVPLQSLGESRRTRAFLKIQEGCDAFCTYCIIPYGRGPSRSLEPGHLVEQVSAVVREGAREVVLTGTNIGDYGGEWREGRGEPPLTELIERLLAETGLERLRVSSLDPTEVTPGLLRLMEGDPRFCPHFHVSLQAASSRVLRLMKRQYDWDRARECLTTIGKLRPQAGPVYVGMDVITGFPGETDEEFERSFRELELAPWNRLHVFPYSERAGTPATRLPGKVPQEVRVRRARRLAALSLERARGSSLATLEACRSENGPLRGILLERPQRAAPAGADVEAEWWIGGYSPSYQKVWLPLKGAGAGERAEALWNQIQSVNPRQLQVDAASGEAWLLADLAT